MHVARNRRTYVARSGERRVYESVLVRRTYRDGGKVKHETLANLSALPGQAVDAIEAALKGTPLVPAGQAVSDHRARCRTGTSPRCAAMAGEAGPARPAGPGLPGTGPGAGADHLPGGGPGVQAVHADLVGRHHPGRRPGRARPPMTSTRRWTGWRRRQDEIEKRLAARHLGPGANPARMALFDLSVLVAGRHATARWPPAATPATARKAGCRSSTGCSPTRRAGRSRCGCSPATPATRPRSPRSCRSSGTSSGWPRWSWSATAA